LLSTTLLACWLLAGAALAADGAAAPDGGDILQPAIPPNQEPVLGAMLGKDVALPAGCTLSSGDVEHSQVKATYTCPNGEVVIQLDHPSVAKQPLLTTERFALSVASGSPPAELVPALTGLIRAHEAEFIWKMPTAQSAAPAPALLLWTVPLVIGLALLAWAWRRRAQRSGGPAPAA
jgi:hypothetical protein